MRIELPAGAATLRPALDRVAVAGADGDPGRLRRAAEDAERAAAALAPAHHRATALAAVGQALAAADDAVGARRVVDLAERAAEEVGPAAWRATALADVLVARASTGDRGGALRVAAAAERAARSEEDALERDRALGGLATALLAVDAVEEAERVTAGVGDPYYRSLTLARRVRHQLHRGDAAGAARTAAAISDPELRDCALALVARPPADAADLPWWLNG